MSFHQTWQIGALKAALVCSPARGDLRLVPVSATAVNWLQVIMVLVMINRSFQGELILHSNWDRVCVSMPDLMSRWYGVKLHLDSMQRILYALSIYSSVRVALAFLGVLAQVMTLLEKDTALLLFRVPGVQRTRLG